MPGRVLVGEGVLTKSCRRKPKPRQVILASHWSIILKHSPLIGHYLHNTHLSLVILTLNACSSSCSMTSSCMEVSSSTRRNTPHSMSSPWRWESDKNTGLWLVESRQLTWILASDGSKLVTLPGNCKFCSRMWPWSLWMTQNSPKTAGWYAGNIPSFDNIAMPSDWSIQIMWPKYKPLIGCFIKVGASRSPSMLPQPLRSKSGWRILRSALTTWSGNAGLWLVKKDQVAWKLVSDDFLSGSRGRKRQTATPQSG